MIRPTLLAVVLTVSAFAGTFPVSTAPLDVPPGMRGVPELAAGRDGYLALWTDHRSGGAMLLAARVGADGAVLDPTGIVIAPIATSAKVLWNGQSYLVFFSHGPNLAMRAVAEDGAVGPVRTVVANALLDQDEPLDAATNGERIVIAYAADKPSWQVKARMHAAVLSMDGALIADLLLDEQRVDWLEPSVAVSGSTFVVAWNRMKLNADQAMEGFDLQAVRLDGRGARLDAQPRHLGFGYRQAVVRPNGHSFLADREYETWFVSADLSQTGAPVERPPGRIFTLGGAAAIVDEDHTGTSGAEIPRWVRVVPYDAQGRPGGTRRIVQATEDGYWSVGGASAVQRGGDVLVAWMTYRYAPGSGHRLSTTLASADTLAPQGAPRLLTRSAAAQHTPSIAAGQTEALVTWTQSDGVYAGRVTADGRPLDGAGIKLSEGGNTNPPFAAYHGGRYAVAFGQEVTDQQWEVVVRFFSPDEGLLPEAARIPVARWAGNVAMASGGGSLVLVYTDGGIHATRIHAGGTFDPPVAVVPEWGALDPILSWNGTHFLIAWIDTYLDYDWLYQIGISGRRMTPELQFADAEPRLLVSFGFSRDHDEPALASNGSDWFLTWTHFTSRYDPNPPSDESKQIRIARIGADGSSDSRLGTALTRGFASELVWTGTRLFVSWKDDAPGTPLSIAPVTDGSSIDARAMRTLDPAAMIYDARQVSLARWGRNWAAAYPLLGGTDTGHVPRVLVTVEGRTPKKMRAVR